MGTITKTNTFSSGATIVASEHNTNFDEIISEINGEIENVNIKATAAIVDTKLAQITTASKVSGTALTSLTSVPSGAGALPLANTILATGTDLALSGTDGNVLAIDVSAGKFFRATVPTSFTLLNPTNAINGQGIIVQLTQGTDGSSVMSLDSEWQSSSEIGTPTLSTGTSATDAVGAYYDGTNWQIVAIQTDIG